MSNESDKELYAAFEHGAESRESEIESLRQRLNAALDDLEVAKNVANGNVEAKFDAWKQLDAMEHELAAALAACKLKDEAITSQMKVTSWEEQAWANDLSEKALAIQLDDISGVILCHAEPVGYDVTTMDGKKMLMRSFCNIVGHKSELLYRAWEPTK